MMQKQTNLKTKIPTWQAKTKSISKEKIDQSKSKITKLDKTSVPLSQSSSSSLMSIRADSQTKYSQTQSTKNTNLKPKSKLYKPSIIEKKNLPNFASKLNSNSNKKDLLNKKSNDMCANLPNFKENQTHNQNDKNELREKVKFNKVLKEKNTCPTEMANDRAENLMNQNLKTCETKDDNSKSLVDHSVDTWKESINEFKRKFSNIPKLDITETKISSPNKIDIDKNAIRPLSTSLVLNQESTDKQYESICHTNSKNLDKSDCPEKTEVKKHSVEFRQKESLLSRKNYTRPKVPTEKQILAHSVNDFKPDTKNTGTEMIHNEAPKKTAFRNKEDSNSSKSCCQNQEEILEEFKNSLNELIKASKWTRESQIGNRSSHIVSMHEPSFNVEENKHHERLTMRKSTTLTDHHAFNVLNFKNQTFSIDKSKSSEFFKLASNLPSDLNSSLYIQTPQVSKQTDSIGNQVVSPLSSSPSVLNTSLTYSSDSAKSSLLNIRSTSSNNLNDSSSSSSTTLQTQKQPKYEQNLLTSTKRFSKPKSVYLTKEDISSNTHANDSSKRFSTTSEILSKKPSNQDLVDKKISTFQSNLNHNQRKSIQRLSTSESVQSFQMIEKNPQLNSMQNSQDPRRYSDMKHSTSKSLNKFQFETNCGSSVTPLRKSANSWIAQSFRKAFSKIDKKKMKSQSQLNQTSKNTISTLSINCNENEAANEKPNTDDENETTLKNKLSLPRSSHDCLNDSESEFDDDENFKKNEFVSKHSKNLIMTKRSYRSESELAFKNLKQKELNINHQVNKTSNLITIDNNMSKIREGKIPSKLKNHKSVSSLLTTSISSNQIMDQMNSRQRQNLKVQGSTPCSPNSSQKFINKCNCKLNESMVTDLKKKLTNAENKLTDIRLEALSSIHQIDQLRECMDKMKNEMIELKSENSLLKNYIQETKCDRVDVSKANELIKNSENTPDAELSDKIVEMLQSVNRNMTNYYYSYNFLLNDENEMLLRKALVTIDCSYQLQFSPNTDNISINSYRLCTINIDSKLKWPLMDGIVSYVFKRYISKLDQNKSIGLNQYSIDRYQIGDMVRRINDPKYPDLLPFGYLIGNNCIIKIFLKDDSNHVDTLSYETLIPKYLLEDYVSMLEKHRLLAISGLFKFGKTYLMYKLSQFVCKNSEKNFEIFYLNIDELTGYACGKSSPTNSMNTLMSKIDEKLGFLEQLNRSLIILIDNFHILFNTNDFDSAYFLNYVCHIKTKYKAYFVITCNEANLFNSKNFQIPLDFYNHFKWVNLNIHYEEFLQYYLNRNLVNYQVDNNKAKQSCAIMEKVVWFICEVYRLINEFISKLGLKKFILMPINFMNLPFGTETSEKWFIEQWNYSIIPYLNDLFKFKIENNAPKQADPVEWIIKNYVWSKNSNSISISQRLQRIKIDEKYVTKGYRASASSNDSDLSCTDFPSHSETGTHLVSMLLKLQQATNLTCKDENISSGYYDSSSSSASTSSTSPNCNFKQTNCILLNSLTNKSKIESSL